MPEDMKEVEYQDHCLIRQFNAAFNPIVNEAGVRLFNVRDTPLFDSLSHSTGR